MSKKKVPKNTFYGLVGGFFSQKKKMILGNVKHSSNERDISLVKLGSGGMYLDMDSESSCGKDNMVLKSINSGSLLDLAATTSKAKRVNSNMVFGSLLGSPNYDIDEEAELLPPPLISVKKLFALDINFSVVEGKSATAKTQFIRKIFSTTIVIKKILMDTPKKMIVTALIGMWQKAVVKFTELEQSFLIGKNLVHMAMAVEDHDTWMFRDCFKALLFTLPIGTTAYNLGTFLEEAGWTWLDLVQCEKCGRFKHSALECNASDTLVSALSKKTYKKTASDKNRVWLTKLYVKKNVPISCPAAFGGKSWTQIVSSVSSSGGLLFEFGSGSGSFSSGVSDMVIFTSGLEKSFLGAGVTVIMNEYLTWYISKMEKVPGWIISIRLLFKDNISISIVDLYAGASFVSRFSQASVINFFIAKAVNSSTFVILGRNFNENRKEKNANVKIERTIDFIFVNCNLSSAVAGHEVNSVVKFFNTNHQAVSVLIGLRGLVDSDLNSLHKQANSNKEYSSDKFAIALPEFNLTKDLGDLNMMWDILRKAVVMLADKIFSKYWFSDFKCTRNKYSSKFFRLELLVAKIVKSLSLGYTVDFACFLYTWSGFNKTEAFEFETLINNNVGTKVALWYLTGVKKKYHKSKYYESKMARDDSIRKAIDKHMENFSSDKGCMIQSVLDQPVQKVMLNHLIVNNNLILDPCDINAFADVISDFSLNELLVVVSNLLDNKAARLSDITNELFEWFIGNLQHVSNSDNEDTLTNTKPIALIKTAHKVLSKLLSDKISLACSKFDVLQSNNFSVLKGMSTLSPIFAVGSVVKDALEKGREAYNSVEWHHLKNSLNRIKMCPCFVKFFENIHNGWINYVITDFELTSGYTVHDGLDQSEVFSLLLWKIFYDSLLCEVKKFEYVYDYKIESRFFICTGKPDFGSNKVFFMAVGAFSILNIASKFFCVNDISINTDKTVAIPINKKRLSCPSIAKTHLDLKFFTNLVLRKANKLLKKSLKLKTNLPKNFPTKAFYHPGLYNMPENSLANFVFFANSVSILGDLFEHHAMNLQTISWLPRNPLNFPIMLPGNPVDCFLAGIINILSSYGLSLGSSTTNVFHVSSKVAAADVLRLNKIWDNLREPAFEPLWQKRLDPRRPTSDWFISLVEFIESGGLIGGSDSSYLLSSKFFSYNTGYIRDCLRQVGSDVIPIYTNSSVRNFSSFGASGGTAAYFPSADIGVGIRVFNLLSSMLAEMQAITLVLDCVPNYSSVMLFTNSQALLDLCVTSKKNAGWSVKDHAGIVGNKCANFFAGAATGSSFILPVKTSHHFLSIEGRPLSGNAYHMARRLYEAVNLVR
ncbi:hypothetical protein G9A89_014463 [Geosiphon pyriformis]|nr:hypothetical protein G9A89_014463 [Geosiphon pyriformis]